MKKKIQKKISKKKRGAKKIRTKAVKKAKKQKMDPKIAKKVKDYKVRTDRLLAKGRERGFVTYDEILKEFPHIEDDIVFLDDLYAKLSVSGVDILEGGGILSIDQEEVTGKKMFMEAKANPPMIQSKCTSKRSGNTLWFQQIWKKN